MKKSEVSHLEAIAAYRKLLDDLGEMAKKENITMEERRFLTEQMIAVTDKISTKDTEYQKRISDILKCGTTIVGFAIVIGATILGVNVRGKEIPMLKR